jgi:hypothetical protein
MASYDTAGDTPEVDTPEGLLDQLKGWFRQDHEAAEDWRKEAEEDYAQHAGHGQWKEGDKSKLESQGRPCITFNRIQPVVSAVVGMAINDRKEVTFKPRTTQSGGEQGTAQSPAMGQAMVAPDVGNMGNGGFAPGADDQGPAETFSAGAEYLRDQCDAEDEEADAFQDTAICGMGWVETTVSYDENPDGELAYHRIDPLEKLWDCKSQKRNLADSRRNWWIREVDIDEAKEKFVKEPIDLDASWARLPSETQPHDREAARFYENEQPIDWDPKRKTVTMVHCEYKVRETAYRAANPATGEVIEVEKDQLKQLKENAKAAGVQLQIAKRPKTVYYTAIIGRDILSWEKSQSQKAFAHQCITGYRDRNKKQWTGLVRPMRDPQKWANALFSSVLHQIQTSGKGVMMEKDAVDDAQKAERDWANASRIVWVKTGALGQHPKIKQKEQNSIPAGTMDMMQFALGALRDVTGVNIEAMGLADRQQAASLEYQRRQAASTILAPFFDGLRRYRKDNGRLILDLMRSLLTDGRLVRVVGPDYEKYVPLLQDDDTLEYDIIIDESASSPNQKEASWLILQQMLPVIGKNLSAATLGKLMKASPLPESVVDDFVEAAEKEAQNAPPPPEVFQMQLEQQKHEATMAMNQQKMQMDGAKAQADLQLKQMDIFMKGQEIELAKFQAGADMQIKGAEMDFKRQEMDGKAKEGEAQRKHDATMRSMEIGAQIDTEMLKNPEASQAITGQFGGLGKGLETLATAVAESNKAIAEAMAQIAEGQAAIAQAMTAPKVSVLSPDGMTATTRIQ